MRGYLHLGQKCCVRKRSNLTLEICHLTNPDARKPPPKHKALQNQNSNCKNTSTTTQATDRRELIFALQFCFHFKAPHAFVHGELPPATPQLRLDLRRREHIEILPSTFNHLDVEVRQHVRPCNFCPFVRTAQLIGHGVSGSRYVTGHQLFDLQSLPKRYPARHLKS